MLTSGIIGLPSPTAAHDVFRQYIQHSIHLTVGARYIDLVVDLTFFEEWSARERALMDANHDARVTRSELATYLKKLAPQLASVVQLRIAEQEFTPVPLYDPEIDLLGDDKVGPAHHRLRLCFFLPTPPELKNRTEIIVEDRLWPEAKALVTLQPEPHDGCKLEAEKPSDPALSPAEPGEARKFRFVCLKPPVAGSSGSGDAAPLRTGKHAGHSPPEKQAPLP